MDKKMRRTIMLNLPYIFVGLFATNLGEAWRMAGRTDNVATKVQRLVETIPMSLSNPLPSMHIFDVCIGACAALALRFAVYMKSKNARKYRHGMEYGSARWGTAQDIEPFMSEDFRNNVILTKTERLMLDGRPKNPKYARNKNVLIVGGSGSGKTRFFLLPNLMQMYSSYVITDPKGDIVNITGKMLLKHGYELKILNTIDNPTQLRLMKPELLPKVCSELRQDIIQELSVPAAGVGDIVSDYVGAAGEKSVDLLSTTAVGTELTEYNEYYDRNGGVLGKLIVCDAEGSICVYDRIPGNERVERGDTQMAQVVGRMERGDVATLVGVTGSWCQIVAENFHGYINRDLIAIGKEAEAMNNLTWLRIAIVNDDGLMLNAEPDYNSELLGLLSNGLWFPVMEEGEAFSKIFVPNVGEGWIENAYVEFQTIRRVGLSNEESVDRAQKIAACVSAADDLMAELAWAEEETAYVARYAHIDPSIPDTDDVAALRSAVASYAQQFVGWLPYVSGGNSLESGADCCGFTQAIYREFGYDIPRTTDAQMYSGVAVSLDDIRPGDIVYYGGHVALYIGGDTVVHEPVPGDVCSYQSIYMMPIYGVVRYIN